MEREWCISTVRNMYPAADLMAEMAARAADVIFLVVETLNTLQSFRFKHKFIAPMEIMADRVI